MSPSALRFRLASLARLRSLSAGPFLSVDELSVPGPSGHVELAAPVAHPWFRATIAAVLDLTHSELARILDHNHAFPSSSGARGAAAIREALRSTDLVALYGRLHRELRSRRDDGRLRARFRVCDALLKSGNRPEWLVLEVLLVPRPCPPELKHLYSAVLESDSARVGKAVETLFGRLRGLERRPSLTSYLGRRPGLYAEELQQGHGQFVAGVLAPAPDLDLDECGLPVDLALNLFRADVVARLARRKGIVDAIHAVNSDACIARDALEEVLRSRHVVLVRPPATSRERMCALKPVVVGGQAIRVHPLLSSRFETTFDGTSVCVFAPRGRRAQRELEVRMRPQTHSRSSITGAHLLAPGRDIALGAHLATRMPLDEHPRAFANIGEVHAAFDLGEVTWRSPALWRIGGHRHRTTVGRILFFGTFPECLPFERANRPVCAADLRNLIDEVELLAGCEEATAFARRLCVWSLDTATRHGFSLGIGDVAPLPESGPETAGAQASIVETRESFERGEITDGERYNRLIDAWINVERNLRASLPKSIARNYPALNAALAAGDAPLRESLLRVLGFGGLAKSMRGVIVEVPVASSLRSSQLAHHLTRLLTAVLRDLIVTQDDCGALDGLECDLREHWPFEGLVGRVLASSARDPLGLEVSPAGMVLSVEEIQRLLRAGAPRVLLRSPICCLAPRGMCAVCFGRDPVRRARPAVGTRVGLFAAAAVGKSAALLSEREFHIGSSVLVRRTWGSTSQYGGTVRFVDLRLSAGSTRRALNDGGSIAIQSPYAEPEWFLVPQGASVLVRDGDTVLPETLLIESDPFFMYQVAEVGGSVRYRGLIEGVTVQETVNEVTGLANLVVVDAPQARLELSLVDKLGQAVVLQGERLTWTVPPGTVLVVHEGDIVQPGDILTKFPIRTEYPSFAASIGGIRQLADVLRLVSPPEMTTLNEIDGVVSKVDGGIAVTPTVDGAPRPDLRRVYPRLGWKHCCVHDGERVCAGTPLFEGDRSPRDVLRILGPKPAARVLLSDLSAMFKKDGIAVLDSYLEVVVSQMLAWVRGN
jgi:DNA-directed RNA polymerase subunit beta'